MVPPTGVPSPGAAECSERSPRVPQGPGLQGHGHVDFRGAAGLAGPGNVRREPHEPVTSDQSDSTAGSALTPHSEDLKSNFKRTVRLDRALDGSTSLSKHFHAPGLGRLRDGWRARSEAAALREAGRRGLPVPAVLGVERNGPSWTLRLQWIPGARALGEETAALTSPGAARAPLRRRIQAPALARSVGQLLAAVEAAGLRHPDPHAQNVLVDEEGALWLVDLARSRFAPHTAASFRRALIHACARLRDLSTPAFRALIFRAYLRARPSDLVAPDPLEIERKATLRQRRDIRRRVKVWRRNSSMTVVEQSPSKVVRARRAGDEPAAGWHTERIECSSREAGAIWAHLVRAELHRLPAARPRRLALAPPYFVEFDVPSAGGPPPAPAALGALAVQLADRGLELVGSPLTAEDGAAIIPPRGHLRFTEVLA